MKERKFGKKQINGRRPLPATALRRRYRHRHEEAALAMIADHYDLTECDLNRNQYDNDYYWGFLPNDMDYLMQESWQLLHRGGWGPIYTYLAPLLQPTDESSVIDATPLPTSMERLEERLATHLQQLTTDESVLKRLPTSIRNVVRDADEFARLQEIAAASEAGKHLVLRLLMFAPFWHRPLRAWQPQGEDDEQRLFSLLDHLLLYYPVPSFLYSEWLRPLEAEGLKWICWFILLGAGRSLQRAAPYFGWVIPRKFQAQLLTAPSQLTIREACIYAEILRLGGSLVELRRLCLNAAFVIDPTAKTDRSARLHFWQETVAWLIRNRQAMTDHEAELLLAWGMHQATEAERIGPPPFSWRGRSVRRALEAAQAYRRQLERPYTDYHWQPQGWAWREIEDAFAGWSCIELTTGQELFEEGTALHHCVSGYAPRCVSGSSAIVSLRYDEKRRITIEIHPRTKRIVQARGLQNRLPTAQEQSVINHWWHTVVLKAGEVVTSLSPLLNALVINH